MRNCVALVVKPGLKTKTPIRGAHTHSWVTPVVKDGVLPVAVLAASGKGDGGGDRPAAASANGGGGASTSLPTTSLQVKIGEVETEIDDVVNEQKLLGYLESLLENLLRKEELQLRRQLRDEMWFQHMTGTPGVGKSWFALWFMACLLKGLGLPAGTPEVSAVLYRYVHLPKEDLLFQRNGRVLSGPPGTFASYLQDPNAWYVLDGVAPLGVGFTEARIVVVTSPNPKVTKDFLDGGAVRRYMPLWTWEEIRLCWQMVYPPQLCPLMTEQRVSTLLDYFGGVP
ncbi:hypothetical protein JKP88DRAFT_255766 [Tribonema minus]|uniref:Uncharacterized protein n=1 Tax=Tribonema minus TaxID=303371 RepID=A0A836CH58_9STRA|nr:hypothetical protein JKP88DRAFT_255766 [Tribonema minus]